MLTQSLIVLCYDRTRTAANVLVEVVGNEKISAEQARKILGNLQSATAAMQEVERRVVIENQNQ